MKGMQVSLYNTESSLTAGRLIPRDVTFEAAPGRGLKLTFDFVADKRAPAGQWLTFEAAASDRSVNGYRRGRVDINPLQRPRLNPPVDEGREFLWVVEPRDLQALEAIRARTQPLVVRIDAWGLLRTEAGVLEFRGDGTIEVAVSEWASLLEAFGYRVPASLDDLVSDASTSVSSWADAADRLAPARRHLRVGETHAALESCLGEFEKLATKPYLREAWLGRFEEMPAQKADAVASMLSGFGTYLNRVGHHKDRLPDEAGDFQAMPVDSWEAETAVATAHLLLALALRDQA
jgi:hypothetical protein